MGNSLSCASAAFIGAGCTFEGMKCKRRKGPGFECRLNVAGPSFKIVRMALSPEEITIAVTVFSRREFVLEAIGSALNQTVRVKVIVVEDCGPDPALQGFVTGKFGNRIDRKSTRL